MKKSTRSFLIILFFIFSSLQLNAQRYVKLNALYAFAGVINPAVEFPISNKSTFQTEIVYSPWLSIHDNGYSKPMHFGIFMNEFRRYLKEHNQGWYCGLNAGMMAFSFSKPYFDNGKLKLNDGIEKGYGIMVGACVGYEYIFHEKWLLDAYFGWAYMNSMYNGYRMDGTIIMDPHRPEEPASPDPWNGSVEWYPNKIGLSIGYKF